MNLAPHIHFKEKGRPLSNSGTLSQFSDFSGARIAEQ